jgi:hypothetical protein
MTMLPKLNAKRRNKLKRKIKRQSVPIPGILRLKQTKDLQGASHRGLVVGLTKVNDQYGNWR